MSLNRLQMGSKGPPSVVAIAHRMFQDDKNTDTASIVLFGIQSYYSALYPPLEVVRSREVARVAPRARCSWPTHGPQG